MQTNRTVHGFMVALLAVLGALPALANNIRVANVAAGQQDVDAKQVQVGFDLSWENSWRNGVNWDAAWVFVKFRPQGSNDWQHAHLSTNSAAHSPASGSVIAAVPDGRGVFVHRDSAHTGPVNYANTRLLWQYGTNGYAFARGAQVEISVHAIEMVYVAEGAFYVGSGGLGDSEFYKFPTTTSPYSITNENAITVGEAEGNLWYASTTYGGDRGGPVPAAFPKGFRAFYCMKYEITQGQYAEFLNLLTSAQKTARFPNNYGNNRHTIRLVDGVYEADRSDRACNWISWEDGASYAAWAGLRPMTELEFEKACRGPETPVASEYAWGTNTIMSAAKAISGTEDGTETVTTTAASGGAHYGNTTITGSGDGGSGPLRVGIFATNGATCVTAGASYWGIMELSGNLWERAVTVGSATGRLFEGSHGTGTLILPSDWAGAGWRGGCWSYDNKHPRVSYRNTAALGSVSRDKDLGFRAVRSTP